MSALLLALTVCSAGYFAHLKIGLAQSERDLALRRATIAQASAQEARESLYALYIEVAEHAWQGNDPGYVREVLARCHSLSDSDRRGFEWYWLWNQSQQASRATTIDLGGPPVCSLAFSPLDDSLVAASSDGTINLLAMADNGSRATLRGHCFNLTTVLFGADGEAILCAGGSGEIGWWERETGWVESRVLKCQSKVASLALSPDGKTLASGNVDGTVQLWNPGSGEELANFDAVTAHYLRAAPGHGASVWCLAFSPDGNTLATGSGDRTVKLWDLRARRVRTTLDGHRMGLRAVAYSPNGTLLAAGCANGSITLWQPNEGRNLATLRGHEGSITALCFTPDGRTLASASMDGTVRLWEAETGERLLRLEGHTGPVLCAAFDPKGKILATGGEDGTVRLWRAASPEEVERYAAR